MSNPAAASIALSGELTFATVTNIRRGSLAQLAVAKAGTVLLDLSQVGHTDSAGLALLLELKRKAHERGCQLHLQVVPIQLEKLSQFFGINTFVPVDVT